MLACQEHDEENHFSTEMRKVQAEAEHQQPTVIDDYVFDYVIPGFAVAYNKRKYKNLQKNRYWCIV